jgi:HaeIII restriction endonuclease.
MAKQVKNGKAFEYAIAKIYYDAIKEKGLEVRIVEDSSYQVAKQYFDSFDEKAQLRYILSAQATLDTMFKIEPGLTAQKNKKIY